MLANSSIAQGVQPL